MKQIESKLKTHSRVWITPSLLILIAIFAITVVNPTTVLAAQEKGQKKCSDGIDNDNDGLTDGDDPDCGGGDDGTDAPDAYNLARASFENFGGSGGGISADGQDHCMISRPGAGGDVKYDYWAWQEEIISPAESIYEQHVGDAGDCKPPHDNRSDVSGGGRWFLITTAGPVPLSEVARWLVFDFSDSTDGTACPNLDGDDSEESEPGLGPIYTTDLNPADANPCVDHLTVRLPADRILKSNATTQKLNISIRWKPPGSEYWPPWGSVQYLEPLYLRDPIDGGPFSGRDCRVMSTRPAPTEPHDKAEAELYTWVGPSSSEFIGTYNMPLEVCVIRTSD